VIGQKIWPQQGNFNAGYAEFSYIEFWN